MGWIKIIKPTLQLKCELMVKSSIWIGPNLNNKIHIFGLNGTLVKVWLGWKKMDQNNMNTFKKFFEEKQLGFGLNFMKIIYIYDLG
jgi:hypothetical protein